jgi:AcrR family transcriptional regulator
MDEIASRAHASKATLYRRWPSKAALIIDIPAGRDLDLIADTLIGLNMLRLAEGKPVDREHVTHVLRDVVYPLAIAPPDS